MAVDGRFQIIVDESSIDAGEPEGSEQRTVQTYAWKDGAYELVSSK